MNFKNLPLYRIVVNPDDEETGMSCISFVDDPAIEKDFLCFKEEKKLAFAVQDADKHIITGPAIIAGLPIYRYSIQMGEYYVVFDNETIDNIILKYSKYGLWNNVSLQHDGNNIEGAVMVEFYKKDSEKGIVPKEYEDVADGSLFVSYKITDEELWDQIKNGTDLNGFSIEVNADLELTEETVDDGQEEDDEWLAELMDLLEELGLEVLFKDEKKKFANDIKSTLQDAVDNSTGVELKIEGKTVKGFPYTLFEREGSTNVALWDGKEWNIVNLKDIEAVQTTTAKATSSDWTKAMTSPSYDWVQRQLDIATNVKPASDPKDGINDSIMNGKWVIINYNDEKENPKTGARQCVVMERGYTCAGNAAIRVYEQFGDSRHPEDIAGWRTMLIHRITSFRMVDYLDPITVAPQGFRPIGAGQDRDGFVCTLRSPLR